MQVPACSKSRDKLFPKWKRDIQTPIRGFFDLSTERHGPGRGLLRVGSACSSDTRCTRGRQSQGRQPLGCQLPVDDVEVWGLVRPAESE